MAEILVKYEASIEDLTLIPDVGGRFEVTVDGQLIYSKLETGRHAEPGEVMGLLQKILE